MGAFGPMYSLLTFYTDSKLIGASTPDEGTTANSGGQGLMNITLSFRF